MKNALLMKGLLVSLLALILWVPLSMIEHTIEERTRYRAEAVNAIAASSAGEQKLWGPVLTVQVEEEFDEEISGWTPVNGKKGYARRSRSHVITVQPESVDFQGSMVVEKRAFGLYSTPVYELHAVLSGQFVTPSVRALPALGPNATLKWGVPVLSVGVADTRGISGAPKVLLANRELSTARGSVAEAFKTGFHASGPTAVDGNPTALTFSVDMQLAGTSAFGFVPTGEVSTATLSGNWPHPSFGGDFLPRSRTLDKNTFTAQWGTTALASTGVADSTHEARGFQVKLIEPVDVYQQAMRSVKYGFLFIALSFASFFLFEQIKQLRIHPIQYALVGLAQAVFFLLLTSLSEHLSFAAAYGAAAVASVGLVGTYLASVLRSTPRAMGFGAAMATLYGALYGILQSEQNALLLGSVLLFLVLAAFMLGTRRVDWYGAGAERS
ncbi:cell envelope integrity protein CreD [Rhodoferax aquaticus]|uniref:Cell envelope integrity protein CreD n=1 Tax=Rhodoferax aquaticus TaxID=2527691 RepID=A0A515EUY5_9BURK|nr:cell envelope integrity protein CreD [Rhodoferax aquaticus]QDL56419.1 cell envelope integrity protein CreD [Rhodoferax aquaticus]